MDQPVSENTPSPQSPTQSSPVPSVSPVDQSMPPSATSPQQSMPQPAEAQGPSQSQQSHPHEHHYFLGGIIALVVLVGLAGVYVYFFVLKSNSSQKMTYQTSYPVVSPQVSQVVQEPTQPYENPFVSPTQVYENPFETTVSTTTDTAYQNPFGN